MSAAIFAAFSFSLGRWEIFALFSLVGFLMAFIAELLLITGSYEKDWYQARAGAESVKTLSWRYSVGADPFFTHLPEKESDFLFKSRVSDVSRAIAKNALPLVEDGSSPTETMKQIRASSLIERRNIYLKYRNNKQFNWYKDKANNNKKASVRWRGILIGAEVIAIALAAARAFGGWDIDFAGILSAIIGAGAAWLALKQHTSLSAAYALTAVELEKQRHALEIIESEEGWSRSVADAEEAISREHTMWLASRGEVNEITG
ncbi:membrane protein [Glutamicibacter uratoxydans]|uniref:Membrane protein n=1 Tax=Glutamicibacter uratoxydans TaxID=43667 RepID=A0A4Y4DKD7_GLUUR|nr:membrane protein [Glutamicibacter uratoxydans]